LIHIKSRGIMLAHDQHTEGAVNVLQNP